jgi:hypothetical protein
MAIGYDVIGKYRETMEIGVRFDINLFLLMYLDRGKVVNIMMGIIVGEILDKGK